MTAPVTVEDIYNSLPNNSCLNILASPSSIKGLPSPTYSGLLSITKINTDAYDIIFKTNGNGVLVDNTMAIGQLKGTDGSNLKWERLCTWNDKDIHITNDERTKWNKVDDKVDKANITTTIDENSTDSKVPSAKSVYDLLQTESPGNLTIPLNEDLNNLIYNRTRVWMNSQTVEIDTFTNMPSGHFTECAVIFIPYENATSDYGEQIFVGNNNRIFIRNKVKTTWTAWQRICITSSVADVPKTNITFTSTTNYKQSINLSLIYTVINGICYVSGGITCVSPTSGDSKVYTLPKPKLLYPYYKTIGIGSNVDDTNTAIILIGKNGELNLRKGVAGKEYRCTFSYPVAES